MKLQPFAIRNSLFVLVVIAALGVLAGAVGAQEKPTANQKATSAAKFPAAKKLVSATGAVDADEDSEKERKGRIDEDGPDAIRKREEWFYKQRVFPNKTLPAGARFRAFRHRQRMLEAEGKLVRRLDGTLQAVDANITLGTNWSPNGPKPTTGGFFSPVSGRITAIAVDPSDTSGNTVLIGGAQGGIWRSIDAGSATPTWTPVGDQNASLAMGSIAFAPSAPATVYAGTGEQASVGFDVYYGAGVLKSVNGGVTWTQTCTVASATCPFIGPFDIPNLGFGFFNDGGARISYVSVNPANANLVLAGAQIPRVGGSLSETAGGIYCSDDGGATWSGLLVGGAGSFVGFANATTAYAAIGRPGGSTGATPNGIYKSINADGGATMKCSNITFGATTTQPTAGTMGRIDLGVFDASTVYASVANGAAGSTTNLGVWVTTNGGTTWTQTSAPDICQRQCWYDNVIKVHPTKKDIVFLGGGAVTVGSAFSWVVRSTNGTTGGTFSPAIPTVSGSPGLPHVDVHALAFVTLPSTKVRVYLGNDGGIWRSDDAEAATVAWTNLNQNLTLTQFYPGLSFSSANPNLEFGGTQDNGSQFYNGAVSWVDNGQCGDGGQTAVDPSVPTVVYVTCQNINIHVSTSGGQSAFMPAINGINPNGTDAVDFIPPIAADASTAGRAYFGTDHVYQTNDFGTTWTAISGALPGANAYLTTVASAPKNPAVVYAGSNSGLVFVASNVTAGGLANFVQIGAGSLPPRTVTAVVPDSNDATGISAYAVFSGFAVSTDTKGHIFRTTNGGTSWTDVSCSVASCITPAATDLPNIPVNDLVVDPDIAGTLYAATDLGVYATTDGGATWSTLNSGLPNVAVFSLKLHEPSRVLLATTHGRGAWSLVLTNFLFSGPHIGELTPTTANAGDATATILIDGSGLAGGTVNWDGSTNGVTTTNTTNIQAQATIAASLLTGGGTHQITVTVGPATSNALIFTVLGGAPTITNSTPASAPLNSGATTTITVTGTNFGSTSKVLMNPDVGGTALTTNFVSATQLTATVPVSFMANFGSTNSVGVQNPPPGGGTTVTTRTVTLPTFKVIAPAPANDNFASAQNITSTSFSDTKDSSGATTETNDPTPACAQSAQIPFVTGRSNTIWYKVVPTASGTANIDTIGSSYDSVLSVWSGTSQTALTAVPNGCNDDINPGIVIESQLTNVPLNAGTTYFIMVSSFGQADPNPLAFGGKSVLNFSCTCTIGSGTGSFTIGGSATTVTAGGSGTSTITVTPTGGFTGTANVTCAATGLPAGVTCSPNPLAINVTSAAAATAQLTVNVAAPSTTLTASAAPLEHPLYASGVMPSRGGQGWWTLSAGTGLAAILLLFLPGRKKYRAALGLGLVCVLSFALGCSNNNGGGGGPVATVTQLTVTAPTKVASGAGNTFAFAVSVTGGTPTGQVQLFDGSTALGTAATVSGGSASITSNGLPVGTHAISAHYLGTSSTLASQSGALNVTVTGTTTFAITATPAASNGSLTVSITIN